MQRCRAAILNAHVPLGAALPVPQPLAVCTPPSFSLGQVDGAGQCWPHKACGSSRSWRRSFTSSFLFRAWGGEGPELCLWAVRTDVTHWMAFLGWSGERILFSAVSTAWVLVADTGWHTACKRRKSAWPLPAPPTGRCGHQPGTLTCPCKAPVSCPLTSALGCLRDASPVQSGQPSLLLQQTVET